MKEMKRMILALVTAVMVIFASAALPVLADEGYTDYSGYADDAGDAIPEPIVADDAPTAVPAAPAAPAGNNDTSSGVSFATVFLIFALAVIINAAVSFVIANRFYAMSKKDSHLQAEIRALRRDISEKFTGSVKEIKEKAANVTNSNGNYSRDGGITYKEEEPSEEISEIAKRWNIDVEDAADPDVKIRTPRRTSTDRTHVRNTDARVRNTDTRRVPRTERDTGGIDADEDVSDSVKDKARKFLGDIFPFEEE